MRVKKGSINSHCQVFQYLTLGRTATCLSELLSPGIMRKAFAFLLLAATSITVHLLQRFPYPVRLSLGAISVMRLC